MRGFRPGTSYFENLLERIRDIRSSEKIFWKKILDIYATSIDYDSSQEASKQFFATILERIRDIRSSEKIFWKKILDI